MKQIEQRRGRAHIDYINEIAISYWARLNWKDGAYPECLRVAMKEHREYLIQCLKERRKIVEETMPRCQSCLTPLEQNDIFHYGLNCRECFRSKYIDSCSVQGIPIPPRIPKPRLVT